MPACAVCVSVSVGLFACLYVYRSVWTRSIGQSVCRSVNQSVGRSIGQSVYVPVCVLLSVSIYLSLNAESALATKHPMAWLACILLLLTSANRIIIRLSLSLQHSALRVTVVQPHRAPDRLMGHATPAAGPARTCCPGYNREPSSKPARTLLSYELKRSKRNWRSLKRRRSSKRRDALDVTRDSLPQRESTRAVHRFVRFAT